MSAVDDLLADLNEPQRQAVMHADGPLLILAGPGSGKTRVVTRRAAYLARTAARASQILAITFTNKAANEMRERIAALGAGGGMTIGTFHAFCARLLREHHERAGLDRRFTIFDRADRRKIVRQAIEEAGFSVTNWPVPAVEQEIGRAKNAMWTPDDYESFRPDWRGRTIGRIYRRYEKLLAGMAGLDFDDLLVRVARLLDADGELRAQIEERYRYVLIDEYQDTNRAQYDIARLLTQTYRNLCATGDPDQSIYGWRGASIENILRFEKDYPEAKVVRLEQNYRSTGRILGAAGALIENNLQRKVKTLWTRNEAGPAICVCEFDSDDDEAEAVGEAIAEALASGTAPQEIAVFYRVNSLSRTIEEALLRGRIKYQIARGVEFYNRREIKDVLAYVRVLLNLADELALLRIINVPPRGIGETTKRRLIERAKDTNQTVYDVLVDNDLSWAGRAEGKLRAFAALLRRLGAVAELSAPEALVQIIEVSGLAGHYAGEVYEDSDAARNLDELVSAATRFAEQAPEGSLLDWVEQTALVTDVDAIEESAGVVTLMTLHAAKGLEFTHVFIIGAEEGLVPLRREGDGDTDMEEERRLLFVGMTRARQRLMLSHARYRMRRGVARRTVLSPFLDELPAEEVEWRGVDDELDRRSRNSNRGELPADIDEWTIGTLVRHPQEGLGRVVSIERSLKRTHVGVQFQNGLRRTWVLEFAPLQRVDFDDITD